MHEENCNCADCIWKRILNNQGIIISTIRNISLKYKVENEVIHWIPLEPNQHTLYPQSRVNILNCLLSRINELGPSQYPGTAQSYKWAILNNTNIWI